MGRAAPLVSAFAILLLALSSRAAGQDAQKVLRILDFGGSALAASENSALQNLVTSHIVELKSFRVTDANGQELALREAETAVQLGQGMSVQPLVADYILSAQTEKIGALIVFHMDITKASTGEKRSVADSFSSVNDLILSSRRMTRQLFERSDEADGAALPKQQGESSAVPSLVIVAGTWKGDKNIDRATLFPDGRGFAILSSGQRMALKVSIEGRIVIVAQNQPNSPDFYRPSLDSNSAKIVAQGARPWRWLFSLSPDGASLVGIKESVFVTVEKGQVSLDNNYVRAAQWTRLYR